MPTNYTYMGQYSNTDNFGLMFYNARWYRPLVRPQLGRFREAFWKGSQADSIIPLQTQGTTQAWDHVAPFVFTKVGPRVKPMVIDPSLFDKPVSFDEWVEAQGDAESKAMMSYLGNGFLLGYSSYAPVLEKNIPGGRSKNAINTMIDYKIREQEILKRDGQSAHSIYEYRDYVQHYFQPR